MAQLAIKGHPTRGKEVIEILEMLGGRNTKPYLNGNVVHQVYHIRTCNNEIVSATYTTYGDLFKVFTLEEFLEKFPYKVGDKVRDAVINDSVGEIISAQWGNNENQIIYVVEWDEVPIRTLPYYAIDLQPYKEENMKEKLEQITLDIPKGYEFFGINDDNQVVLAKKQLQYPKNYEECCNILGIDTQFCMKYLPHGTFSYKDTIIYNLQKLLVCRDAYWKIAGEEMGLGKPWEPDWNNISDKYCIYIVGRKIWLKECQTRQCILAFPTAKMRDAFKENFDRDIDVCKEFL